MYTVGQKVNVGYYGGFKHKTKFISKAKIITIDNQLITIHITLPHGGYRRLFGYERDLQTLEENYRMWTNE